MAVRLNWQINLREQIRTHEGICEGKSLRLCALISLCTTNNVHKRIRAFIVCVKHWLSARKDLTAQLLSGSPNALHSFSLRCIETEDKWRIKDTLLSTIHSSIANASSSTTSFCSANADVLLIYFSSELIPLKNDVANELLHSRFINSFIKFLIIQLLVWWISLPAMTSARIFEETLSKNTQVFKKFKISILRFAYISSISTLLLSS